MTPTTEYTVAFCAGVSTCIYIYRQISVTMREAKHDKEPANGKAGERFLDAKFESLESHAERQTKILDKQTDILQDHSKILIRLEERSKP